MYNAQNANIIKSWKMTFKWLYVRMAVQCLIYQNWITEMLQMFCKMEIVYTICPFKHLGKMSLHVETTLHASNFIVGFEYECVFVFLKKIYCGIRGFCGKIYHFQHRKCFSI